MRRIAWLVVLIWLLQALNSAYGLALNQFGIYPRDWQALPGILFWVFLHGSLAHLVMNTPPLLLLGFFVALRGTRDFIKAVLIIVVIGGLGVWLFGRPAYHIGASGLVFGFFGFLVAVGLYERRIQSLLIASLAVFYYGGLLFGVLPQDNFVSWEGHLFGLLAGILAASLLARRRRS